LETISEGKPKRPALLVVLCILTFFGSGASALANTVMYITIDDWKLAYENGLFDNLKSLLQEDALEVLMNISPNFYLIQAVLYFISLGGALLMWNLQKPGFHLYAIAQILLLISYNMYVPDASFPVFPLLLTITFILLYYRNLSVMR
jgi:hypothetical protein